jgi:alcohol dehydrogenase class IV
VAALRRLNRDVSIPVLRSLDVPQDRFESLLEKMASDALASGSPANNPRLAHAREIIELYQRAYAESSWN